MIPLVFRPIKVWPEGWQDPNRERRGSPFSATYSSTLSLLELELRKLGATEAILQVDASDRDVRLDGGLRADAKVRHPGVILTIDAAIGTLVYATDEFTGWGGRPGWQENLRAIALGLEALRAVERYGIATRGEQYAGYREIGSGIPLGDSSAPMTRAAAAAFLIEWGEWGDTPATIDEILDDGPLGPEVRSSYFREAAKKLHPDAGGDPELFRRLSLARETLEGKTR